MQQVHSTARSTALAAVAALHLRQRASRSSCAFSAPPCRAASRPQHAALPMPPSRATRTRSSRRACSARSSTIASREAPGTIIVDTPHTYLYFVLGNGKAMRYGIGVGREGFTWSGVKSVARKAEWPDWYPPAGDDRAPALSAAHDRRRPRQSARRPRACISAAPSIASTAPTIRPPSARTSRRGCIRLTNDDVIDLFNRVQVGAKVIVLPQAGAPLREAKAPAPRERMSFNAERAPALY